MAEYGVQALEFHFRKAAYLFKLMQQRKADELKLQTRMMAQAMFMASGSLNTKAPSKEFNKMLKAFD